MSWVDKMEAVDELVRFSRHMYGGLLQAHTQDVLLGPLVPVSLDTALSVLYVYHFVVLR